MVDDPGPVDVSMLFLVHLGQLRTSYGPEDFQKSRSLAVNAAQGFDFFKFFFFLNFWVDQTDVQSIGRSINKLLNYMRGLESDLQVSIYQVLAQSNKNCQLSHFLIFLVVGWLNQSI